MAHDPVRYSKYLMQCLSQDKRPLGIFLAAGCPLSIQVQKGENFEPLIPDVRGMTRAICADLRDARFENCGEFELLCQHFAADGNPDFNIEDLLSHVRSLKQVAGTANVRGLDADMLDSIDREICDKIFELVSKKLPSGGSPYHLLAKWIGAIERDFPVEIFTTNYDLLMEEALEDCRVPYFDGFIGSNRTFFDPHAMEEDKLPPRWARLWKLHGSVNWRQSHGNIVSRGEKILPDERRLIHPSHLKYAESRRMPYLAMIDRLRAFLKKPQAVMVVSGYSFSDEHLNEVIIQGLRGNSTAIVFGLLYGGLNGYPRAKDAADSCSNLSLLSFDRAVIGSKDDIWDGEAAADIQGDAMLKNWASVEDGTVQLKLGDFARSVNVKIVAA